MWKTTVTLCFPYAFPSTSDCGKPVENTTLRKNIVAAVVFHRHPQAERGPYGGKVEKQSSNTYKQTTYNHTADHHFVEKT